MEFKDQIEICNDLLKLKRSVVNLEANWKREVIASGYFSPPHPNLSS
jgi:hypothetical protein